MTKLLIYILMLLSVSNLYGQVWNWAEQGYGTNVSGDDHGQDIVTDANGYSYVTGMFQDTVTFGSFTLYTVNENKNDMFLAKYNPNGNVVWVRQAGGNDADYGLAVSLDNLGNCYVTGAFRDTAIFGTDTIYAPWSEYLFIAKYDTSGNYQWVKSTGYFLATTNFGAGLAHDILGNTYTTGMFQDTITFDSFTLIGGGIYVAKFDLNGNCLWAVKERNENFPSPSVNRIAVDGMGNCYIAGRFSDTLSFITDTLIALGDGDGFIAKYNSSGLIEWARQVGGADIFSYDEVKDIITTSSGDLYVIGDFYGTGIFDNINLTSAGAADIFVSKWNTNGNIIWAKKAGGTMYDYGYGIELSFDGNLYITGSFADSAFFDAFSLFSTSYTDLYVANYDTLGNVKYAIQSIGSTASDEFSGSSISSDNLGNVYLIGTFQGSAILGSIPISTTGYHDILVARINPLENAIQELLGHQEFKIYPNPTSQSATLEFNNSAQENLTLTVYDSQGRLIETVINIKTDKIAVEKGNLPPGLYFFQMYNESQIIFSGKLIMK